MNHSPNQLLTQSTAHSINYSLNQLFTNQLFFFFLKTKYTVYAVYTSTAVLLTAVGMITLFTLVYSHGQKNTGN